MAELTFISLVTLKERLLARQIPLPNGGDTDLTRLINVASAMVADRVAVNPAADPQPAAVQQATLMLAMRMRVAETMNYADADGRPITVKLWTPDIDDILGSLLTQETPGEVIHAPVQGSIDVPLGHKRAVRVQAHRGRDPRGYWEIGRAHV